MKKLLCSTFFIFMVFQSFVAPPAIIDDNLKCLDVRKESEFKAVLKNLSFLLGSGLAFADSMPSINSLACPSIPITPGSAFNCSIDTSGNHLSYSIINNPSGMTFGSSGVSWSSATIGSWNVVITISNGAGSSSRSFQVIVETAPTLDTIPNFSLTVGDSFAPHTITASGGNLTFSLSGPTGMSISNTGVITWDSAPFASSNTYPVTVTAQNSTGTATRTFTVTVAPASGDTAPTIADIADVNMTEGDSFSSIQVNASGGNLTFTLSGAPTGMTINSSGLITWPDAASATARTYNVTVNASNSAGSTNETFTITISADTEPPVEPPVEPPTGSSGGQDLCAKPPFTTSSAISPNVLIAIDNSESMYDLAYTEALASSLPCYNNISKSIYDSGSYYGFYETNKYYAYNTSTKTFGSEADTMQSSDCSNSESTEDEFCIKVAADGTLTHAYFRGKFLNWLTMSKLDIEKKVLTGGKYVDTDSNGSKDALVGESRGCLGRRLMKEILDSGMVFGVRSKNSGESGVDNNTTAIEIFYTPSGSTEWTATLEACQDAIEDWYDLGSNGQGQFKNSSEECLEFSNPLPGVAGAFNDCCQNCFKFRPGGPWETRWTPGQFNQTKQECEHQVYGDNTIVDTSTSPPTVGIYWDRIGDPFYPGFYCSRYTNSEGKQIGLGWCYDGTVNVTQDNHGDWTWNHAPNWGDPFDKGRKNPDGSNYYQTDDGENCIETMMREFCATGGAGDKPLDPSGEMYSVVWNADDTAALALPAMLLEAAVARHWGDDPIAVLFNRKQQTQSPTGVLHDVTSSVRLGLMVLNKYGSKYEFDNSIRAAYNMLASDKDGGWISSYLSDNNSGIIDSVNAIIAETWTPIGESFYEVVRYFKGKPSAYENIIGNYVSPIQYACQGNHVILLSDGGSTVDRNLPGSCLTSGTTTVTDDSGFQVSDTTYLSTEQCNDNTSFGYSGTWYAKAVAKWAHTTDLRSDLTDNQTLNFHTVSTLGSGDLTSDETILLQQIASEGGGSFKQADTGAELQTALTQFFKQVSTSGSAGSVATVSQQTAEGDVIVRGAFENDKNDDQKTWKGHLEVFWPDNVTKQYAFNDSVFCMDNDAANCLGEDATTNCTCLDTGQKLAQMTDISARKIITMVNTDAGPVQADFKDDDLRVLDAVRASLDNSSQNDFDGDGTLELDCTNGCQDVKALINYIRGDTSLDNSSANLRNRYGWRLGDIVYSTPLLVGQPSLGEITPARARTQCFSGDTPVNCDTSAGAKETCFYCFRDEQDKKDKVVYVGANDGMLHAFSMGVWCDDPKGWIFNPNDTCNDPSGSEARIGSELWAYIPSNLISELQYLARPTYGKDGGCAHRTMVDLSPTVASVNINESGLKWKRVLIGGERGGGDVYFAIDVTNPSSPTVKWEYSVLRNMVLSDNSSYSFPYLSKAAYEEFSSSFIAGRKLLPVSWSRPYVGNLNLDAGSSFRVGRGDGGFSPIETVTGAPSTPTNVNNTNLSGWFAFIGGGARVFNNDADRPPLDAVDNGALKPYFLAIDIQKGIDIFQYIWPDLGGLPDLPDNITQNGSVKVPYAMSDPMAVDLNQDGYTDRIYVGDMYGQLYTLNFAKDNSGTFGMRIDIRQTKGKDTGVCNNYRVDPQPITSRPSGAFDEDDNFRVYIGTGKFNDINVGCNDYSDTDTTGFYSVKESRDILTSADLTATFTNGFDVEVNPLCGTSVFKSGNTCKWFVSSADNSTNSTPECCEDTCSETSCWTCVYDFFAAGERMVNPPLVAGKFVFLTTFIPSTDPCAGGGRSYLYILNYNCGKMEKNPLAKRDPDTYEVLSDSNGNTVGYKADLGPGITSPPALDGSFTDLIFQKSDATISLDIVELLDTMLNFRGVKTESTECSN